jgi:mono/diheme cytochrome c family protein
LLLVAAIAPGCAGDIDEGEQQAGLTPAQKLAQSAWLKQALPALKDGTCNTCHDGSMAPTAPPWMAGDKDLDIRDTVIGFMPTVVSLGSPRTSRIVVKGMHEGPGVTAPQAAAVVTWLTYEQGARPPANLIETMKAPAQPCTAGNPGDATCPINSVDLSAAGSAGSTIEFVATVVGADLYLTQVKVTAGPSGLHLAHPVFETWPMGMTEATPDPSDPYFNVIDDLTAGMSKPLGSGTLTLTNFPVADPLSMKFDELSTKP